MCRRLLIFPGRLQPSIVSASELNFRVRNGNGWTLTAKDTNYRKFFTYASSVFNCIRFLRIWCTFRDSNPGPTD